MKTNILSYWSESSYGLDESADGLFVVEHPDDIDIEDEIVKTVETLKDIEELEPFEVAEICEAEAPINEHIVEFIDIYLKAGLTIPELISWRDDYYGSSLETILQLLSKREGYSFSYIPLDKTYDCDNDKFGR